jgi:hypothetical protein
VQNFFGASKTAPQKRKHGVHPSFKVLIKNVCQTFFFSNYGGLRKFGE